MRRVALVVAVGVVAGVLAPVTTYWILVPAVLVAMGLGAISIDSHDEDL